MSRPSTRWWAYASVYLFWGSTYPAIRFLVHWVPPFWLIGLRMLTAGTLLLGLARLRGVAWPTRRQWLGSAGLGFLFMVCCNGVATWGLQYIEAGKATLMTACVPLVALGYGWAFHGRRVGRGQALCLGLGLLGVALVMKPGAQPLRHWGWGVAAITWAVLVWAVGMVEAKNFEQSPDGIMASGAQMATASVLLLGVALWREGGGPDWGSLPAAAWEAWAYLVVFGSCVGYLFFNWLITHEPPHLAGTYAFVNPVVAVLLGWAFLGEGLGPRTLLASGLIVAAVAGLLRLKKN
ncbi:MAG TPA: EamA family transporter [bacterium]|nr:EamA family transporter [bacterium]